MNFICVSYTVKQDIQLWNGIDSAKFKHDLVCICLYTKEDTGWATKSPILVGVQVFFLTPLASLKQLLCVTAIQ